MCLEMGHGDGFQRVCRRSDPARRASSATAARRNGLHFGGLGDLRLLVPENDLLTDQGLPEERVETLG